ncbi:MAG: CoA transferase [Myxococcota bacterium]
MSSRVSSLDPPRTPRNRMGSRAYALRLLDDMASGRIPPEFAESDPAVAWADSGAMSLTGAAEGPPRLAPSGIPRAVEGAFRALAALAGPGPLAALDAQALLSERAAHFGGRRRGRTSPGGSCRLVQSRDGWIAISLARPDDLALLAAWFDDAHAPGAGTMRDRVGSGGEGIWRYVSQSVAKRTSEALVDRGRLLGLPVASALSAGPPPTTWRRIVSAGRAIERAPGAAARVLDLSSLWAGPLCSHLLGITGAEVVKLESWERPDGARKGAPSFFDLLNAGKRSVALEFRSELGRERLLQLIDFADVVIESSRPRALAQLGIDAAELVRARPGLSWVSITGYGRGEPEANWVAFGDDAAVAAGLSRAVADAGGPLFCGDAIADPLTGLHAAVAALGSFRNGGGELIDLNLCDVSAFALAAGTECSDAARIEADPNGGFELIVGSERHPISAPRTRPASGRAGALGADNQFVFERLDRAC